MPSEDARSGPPDGRLFGFLVFAILLLAGSGLFALYFSNHESNRAMRESLESGRLLDEARQAQVEFKTQVQNWKNLLLRGQNPDDNARYRAAFEESLAAVQNRLRAVRENPALDDDLHQKVDAALADHAALADVYRSALAGYSDVPSIFSVDSAVRGADQKINQQIDDIAAAIVTAHAEWIADIQSAGAARYQTLKMVTLAFTAGILILIGVVAWRSLRKNPRGG